VNERVASYDGIERAMINNDVEMFPSAMIDALLAVSIAPRNDVMSSIGSVADK
jgi:hypothetical protein